jgi:hypothetical protein
MKKTELILGIGILILMSLRLVFEYPYSAMLITLSSLFLSIIYFGFSFGLLNGIRFRNLLKKESYAGISTLRIIGSVLTGIVLSLLVIYSLFKFQSWPYGNEGLRISLFGLLIVIVIGIIKLFTAKNSFYSKLLLRLGIIGTFATLLYFTSYESLLEMKYRNYPEFIEVEKKLMKDPMNKELQIESRELRMKMDKSE